MDSNNHNFFFQFKWLISSIIYKTTRNTLLAYVINISKFNTICYLSMKYRVHARLTYVKSLSR